MTLRGLLIAAGVAAFVLVVQAAVAVAWLWARPGAGSALAASFALCFLVSLPWAFTASLTIGDAAWPPRSYAELVASPFGSAAQFAEVNGGLVVACFLLAGWRSRRGGRR